jgi:hypothetical protein
MKHSSKQSFLDEQLALLLNYYGHAKMRDAFERALGRDVEHSDAHPAKVISRAKTRPQLYLSELATLQRTDKAKHRLLSNFKSDLLQRKLLPETRDIYQFAQLVGIKELKGKSRREMIPSLMDYLVTLPIDQLRPAVKNAPTISEAVRQQGFSLLTDKLLSER